MDVMIHNLDIAFRRLQPEHLYRSLFETPNLGLNAFDIPERLFLRVAHSNFASMSQEEICGVHRIMQSIIQDKSKNLSGGNSVFNLLLEACNKMLVMSGNRLFTRAEYVLDWQQAYLNLGQDIYTTAYYAWLDIKYGRTSRDFLWEAVLKTDDMILHHMLQQGLAENHCHLNGTSQSFCVMWAFFMNHPRKIHGLNRELKQNLQAVMVRGVDDNLWDWEKRLQIAAWLRVHLYLKLKEKKNDVALFDWFRHFDAHSQLNNMIDYARFEYGLKLLYAKNKKDVLDYSLDHSQHEAEEHYNRLMAGERSFLYGCFKRIFSKEWSSEAANAFYLYLLIKLNFRSEIIQVNRQYGFSNFREYQDRKTMGYDNDERYFSEMVRLAVNGNMQDNAIHFFEGRLAPARSISSHATISKIRQYDEWIECLNAPSSPYFYVLHFIKIPDLCKKQIYGFELQLRNYKSRTAAAKGAISLYHAIADVPELHERILGIDAASTEIDCRPETFAPVFRKMKLCFFKENAGEKQKLRAYTNPSFMCATERSSINRTTRMLNVTYHVGEDFRDIADGLRAIDEAVRYLELERGDRIGHALALGVNPEIHYQNKNMRSILPKQDYLDNLVWILFTADECGIAIESTLRHQLKQKASMLFEEIYRNELGEKWTNIQLRHYYNSWLLRGDPPELYETMRFKANSNVLLDENLNDYRYDRISATLYAFYHYSPKVRENGSVFVEQIITKPYINLIAQLQSKMQELIGQKGIFIECNPTSNVLIGTFRDYDKHPIFRFYPIGIGNSENQRWVQVSINTDDLGVFDTSLENEYVVIAAALREMCDEFGKRLYSEESIQNYIEAIRINGLNQTFWPNIKTQDKITKTEEFDNSIRS